jgi:hypothetical protein
MAKLPGKTNPMTEAGIMAMAGSFADGVVGAPLLIQKTFGDETTGAIIAMAASGLPKCRVVDAWIENRAANGANANTVQLFNNVGCTQAISDAMSLNAKADTAIVRAATIDDQYAIADNGGLWFKVTKAGGTMGGNVYAKLLPIA